MKMKPYALNKKVFKSLPPLQFPYRRRRLHLPFLDCKKIYGNNQIFSIHKKKTLKIVPSGLYQS